MGAATKARKRDSGHQVYKLADGTKVPGVTTITGVMAKPALVPWANKLGLEGIDSSKYVDALAAAGTLAHYLVECALLDEQPDQSYLDEFSKVDQNHAETGYLKFLDWQKAHAVKLLGHEMQLVSEEERFGGTCDIYAEVNGVLTLIDVKTCKALYGAGDEKFTQLAGYQMLLEANGYRVDEAYILRIGRNEEEGFEYVRSDRVPLHKQRFLACLDLAELNYKLTGRRY